MNGHERVLLLAAAAIDFPLAPEEAAELEAHLRSCDACRSTAARLRGDAALIAALPRRSPSAEVGKRIVEAAQGARSIGSQAGARPGRGGVAGGSRPDRCRDRRCPLASNTGAADLNRAAAEPGPRRSRRLARRRPPRRRRPRRRFRPVKPGGSSPRPALRACQGSRRVGLAGSAWVVEPGPRRTVEPGPRLRPSRFQPCPGPERCLGMKKVAAGVGGFVAIGEDPTALSGGRPQSGVIWHSKDGLDWTIVSSGPEFELGPCIEGCPRMIDVAGGPAGFVAFGYRVASATPPRTAPVAWFSADGQRWERLVCRPVRGRRLRSNSVRGCGRPVWIRDGRLDQADRRGRWDRTSRILDVDGRTSLDSFESRRVVRSGRGALWDRCGWTGLRGRRWMSGWDVWDRLDLARRCDLERSIRLTLPRRHRAEVNRWRPMAIG